MVNNMNNTSNTSTSSYSYLQYKNKVTGLASGMDIDSLMEKLMKAESAQMEKLQQQKQKYEWKRDAYREVNTSLSAFEKGIFDNYGLSKNWAAKNVTSTSTAISATANSNAAGNLTITEATVATAGQKVSSGATLADLGFSATNGTFTYKIDGQEKSIAYSKTDTFDSLAKKLNATGDFEVTVTNGSNGASINTKLVKNIEATGNNLVFLNKLGLTDGKTTTGPGNPSVSGKLAFTESTTMSELGLTDGGEFTIKAINDQGKYTEKTIKYSATDKISDVMSRINGSGVGVTALAANGKLSLSANSTGTGAEGSIKISADGNKLFEKLGLADATGKVAEGTNGSMVVNGVKMESTSNKYNVSGYTVNVTNNIAATDAPAKISSTTETKTIVDKVKEFITTYNGLIEDLNKRVSQKKNLSYQPLTDAQKAELKDDEIKKWEDKAKEGLLKSDATLNKVLSDMRSTLSNYGSGSEDMLAKIGITTSKTWTDNGKLELDEDKLTKALEEDPNIVSRIFVGDKENNREGIIASLRTTAQNAVKDIEKTAGKASSAEDSYTLGKNLKDVNTKIDDWKDRLKGIEERYWKQFAAMEAAIQKANSQSSIFMQ
ncbi:flagellar filament capping protein FliD [Kurthia sp. YJT4]|uniref:flagellar filament capping protein FliD n=1 Tax=Kurthia sp. YJT4 TaxID=3049086 RepID=UPI00254F2F0E|nr:flagellar filament capping protein FliD [Kurthia sp. YJT4]WIL39136.1 flagellar filament capping protein FliD [Kurthia sp. YJT4]